MSESLLHREKNENNTKKFIDERKSQAIKQAKEKEKLKKVFIKKKLFRICIALAIQDPDLNPQCEGHPDTGKPK